MLKKLVMFAITSGLAKKAWDSYKGKGQPMASSGARYGTGSSGSSVKRSASSTGPASDLRSTGDKPDAY